MNGYFDKILEWISFAIIEGFVPENTLEKLIIDTDIKSLIERLTTWKQEKKM